MRIACIIQARTTSTRLPNKANADIGGWTMWRHVVERVKAAGVEPIMAWAGDYPELSENDVLARYTLCARRNALDAIIRVTSDCPLIPPEAIQRVLERFLAGGWDYVANDWARTWPDGMGVEIMSRVALEHCHAEAHGPENREHVTTYIKRMKKFMKFNILCHIPELSGLKLSVDTAQELDFVRKIDAALTGEAPEKYNLESTLAAMARVKTQE